MFLPSLFLFPALQLYSFDFSLFVHDCTIPWLAAVGVQYISGVHRTNFCHCLNERLCVAYLCCSTSSRYLTMTSREEKGRKDAQHLPICLPYISTL
jgi:hypothetical protein